MIFDLKNVRFENNKIIIEKKKIRHQININNIWTMFYAKWSVKNYFSLAYTPSLSMGYLYIATKEMHKMTEVIKIRIPFKDIDKLPKNIYKKIQFYDNGNFPEILRLK